MTEANLPSPTPDLDEAVRQRILERVKPLNHEVLSRLSIAADHLEEGRHRSALGALDGVELHLATIRSLLRLLG